MATLKDLSSPNLSRWEGTSASVFPTEIQIGEDIRAAYLRTYKTSAAPVISSSEFVPKALVEHLMRTKKNSALNEKFVARSRDQITNMEGALHTYVTPLVLVSSHGDYVHRGHHAFQPLPAQDGRQCARKVVMSAMIHPDFETDEVMLALSALGEESVQGEPLPADFTLLTCDEKQDETQRTAYDATLRRHMILHLVQSRVLPPISSVVGKTLLSRYATPEFLASVINGTGTTLMPALFHDKYATIRGGGSIVSLELLWRSAYHQIRNELSALEYMCPQGYVYTFDPPSIFAGDIGAPILNRLYIAALAHISRDLGCRFTQMVAFGFNDYADKPALELLRTALKAQTHVQVVAKGDLFSGKDGAYVPLPGAGEGALLVIHNNSDAFGQNIETEWSTGSMDGALGCNTSAAASLHRGHPSLLDHMV